MPGILLAPYNDSMRLGQGYNSFLHKPCVLNAVKFNKDSVKTTPATGPESVSQVVNYSSRFVDKISEVAKSMNISAGSSIKNGGTISTGSSLTLDEAKFAASDLNAVVSVKVINQTTEVLGDVGFEAIKDVTFDSKGFFKTYGDCYISGFIEGGEMTGIVSAKVLDIQNKSEIKKAIKGQVNSSGNQTEFILNENSSLSTTSTAMSKTETTITVSWSGGGQIKPPNEPWTLESLYRTAAAFPSNVAKCPQKTWAVLTPYNHSKEFVKWAKDQKIEVPQFEEALVFANDLLDMYMEYKNCVGRLQSVLANPQDYLKSSAKDAIGTEVKDLILARKQVREQIRTITRAVDRLAENPQMVDIIEAEALIMPPEEWSHRIPILSIHSQNGVEWTPERFAEDLAKFSFGAPDDASKDTPKGTERSPGKKIAEEDINSPHFAPEDEGYYLAEEKESFVNTEGRMKFKDFWFGYPAGPSRGLSGMFFNDAEDLLANPATELLHPICVKLRMINKHGRMVLGGVKVDYMTTSYDRLWYTHGNSDSKLEDEIIEKKLQQGEYIVEVLMSKTDETKNPKGIHFIQLCTSAGRIWSMGNSLGRDIIRSTLPQGFKGLKGFYGYGTEGENVERLGIVWG